LDNSKGEREMKKTVFNLLVLFALASLVLSACGGKAATGEGEVAIVAWPGYIERGANDPRV
jgi:predicted small secreted protein